MSITAVIDTSRNLKEEKIIKTEFEPIRFTFLFCFCCCFFFRQCLFVIEGNRNDALWMENFLWFLKWKLLSYMRVKMFTRRRRRRRNFCVYCVSCEFTLRTFIILYTTIRIYKKKVYRLLCFTLGIGRKRRNLWANEKV